MKTATLTPGVKKEAKPAGVVRLTELGTVTLRGRKSAPKAEPDLTPQLESAFRAGGMSEAEAKIAARGRARRAAQSLAEAAREGGMTPAAARTFARGRGLREVAKDAAGLPACAYAYPRDPEDPTTWRLQIAKDADQPGAFDKELVKYAVNQLPGIAGYDKALDIPAADLATVKATLRSAWIACGLDVNEMPAELQAEALRREFIRGGLSEKAAAIAAAGRNRRV